MDSKTTERLNEFYYGITSDALNLHHGFITC